MRGCWVVQNDGDISNLAGFLGFACLSGYKTLLFLGFVRQILGSGKEIKGDTTHIVRNILLF